MFGRVPELVGLCHREISTPAVKKLFFALWMMVFVFMCIYSFSWSFIKYNEDADLWTSACFLIKNQLHRRHWSTVEPPRRSQRALQMLFTELLSKWCYYMKVEFWRVLRSGPRCNSHHPPVHCRLRSFMMECWTTRLNDEWWVWVNYMSEKYRYVSQTSLLSMSDTGRLPTHTHTHTRPVSVVYRESVSRSLRQSAATVIDGVWKWHKSDCCWQTCNTKEISRSDGCVWGY